MDAVLLQRVQIAVHRAEVYDAAVHGRRRYDRADGDETVEVEVHVLEIAEERLERVAIEAAVVVQYLERILFGALGAKIPRQLPRPGVDSIELPVVVAEVGEASGESGRGEHVGLGIEFEP